MSAPTKGVHYKIIAVGLCGKVGHAASFLSACPGNNTCDKILLPTPLFIRTSPIGASDAWGQGNGSSCHYLGQKLIWNMICSSPSPKGRRSEPVTMSSLLNNVLKSYTFHRLGLKPFPLFHLSDTILKGLNSFP